VAAVLAVAMAGTADHIDGRANSATPVVTDSEPRERSGDVLFTWPDAGLRSGDSYQPATSEGASSMQTNPAFAVAGEPGEQVCITVTVNRSGAAGAPSNQKCATIRP